METVIFLPSRSSSVLSHHDTDKAAKRLAMAAVRAKIDWLAPMSTKSTKSLRKALNL